MQSYDVFLSLLNSMGFLALPEVKEVKEYGASVLVFLCLWDCFASKGVGYGFVEVICDV